MRKVLAYIFLFLALIPMYVAALLDGYATAEWVDNFHKKLFKR